MCLCVRVFFLIHCILYTASREPGFVDSAPCSNTHNATIPWYVQVTYLKLGADMVLEERGPGSKKKKIRTKDTEASSG